MKRQRLSRRSTAGFTLLETLVVIIMIGVMFAIAAPSWVTFTNNQRLNTVRSQIFETLRAAQADAKRTKINRAVVFDNNSNRPRMATIPVSGDSMTKDSGALITKTEVQNWQTVGNGEIAPGTIKVNAVPVPVSQNFDASVLFDTYGNVIKINNVALPTETGYKITVGVVSSVNPRRCIMIKTLLGAMQEGANEECQ
ncbi:pilus assembly FimT family protein [Myxacorys almedinensis]|uniref:Prepilin-type N-terminal cleavage/methylation domain-containing protein n=1 Tax=Myxacorys almedinensis A TaxID=2690445 RepID=A0A8J7YZJ9_9CYAN|nr:type II secretion system protein [Myxacorys almedinensis]NDJ16270.1 prepilin-type N-terminal cleavage/methylation domain-containing protein [Myxacorys almedinensis A]